MVNELARIDSQIEVINIELGRIKTEFLRLTKERMARYIQHALNSKTHPSASSVPREPVSPKSRDLLNQQLTLTKQLNELTADRKRLLQGTNDLETTGTHPTSPLLALG